MKKFKNNKVDADTWCGMLIQPGEYYTLEVQEYFKWANNSKVLSDIGSGALIYNENDTDITDVSVAINSLKDLTTKPVFLSSPFNESNGFRIRWKGFKGIAVKNTISNVDFLISEERYVNGGVLQLVNASEGDLFCYQVVDKDNIFGYGAGVVLDEFVSDWNVDPTIQTQGIYETTFLARIYAGLYIRVKYTSVGTENDVTIKLNLLLNKKT